MTLHRRSRFSVVGINTTLLHPEDRPNWDGSPGIDVDGVDVFAEPGSEVGSAVAGWCRPPSGGHGSPEAGDSKKENHP